MYFLAANITDAKQKRALLLYVAGPAVHKIFNTLTDTGTDYKTAVEKLDSYFQPKPENVIYERYVFKQTRPSPDESVDHFITRFRQLADTCEFASVEDEIRDNFVTNKFAQHKENHVVTACHKLKDELSITNNGILLRDTRIIIPKSLQSRTLPIAHEGHQGIAKTKALLRTKVWWPGLDTAVESLVKSCLPCQSATIQAPQPKAPLIMTEMPSIERGIR
ncbi:hypothetical conserved 1030 [Paramuricea clavata]|uniref:TPA_inf: hypothetical conserved 1030 n=1 Tax=Paramuricea clavata TaxID=317549 RepID=A0A6S7L998_PARCT|nr:hypothetical conserved 1030 [Paramuricea clavata]